MRQPIEKKKIIEFESSSSFETVKTQIQGFFKKFFEKYPKNKLAPDGKDRLDFLASQLRMKIESAASPVELINSLIMIKEYIQEEKSKIGESSKLFLSKNRGTNLLNKTNESINLTIGALVGYQPDFDSSQDEITREVTLTGELAEKGKETTLADMARLKDSFHINGVPQHEPPHESSKIKESFENNGIKNPEIREYLECNANQNGLFNNTNKYVLGVFAKHENKLGLENPGLELNITDPSTLTLAQIHALALSSKNEEEFNALLPSSVSADILYHRFNLFMPYVQLQGMTVENAKNHYEDYNTPIFPGKNTNQVECNFVYHARLTTMEIGDMEPISPITIEIRMTIEKTNKGIKVMYYNAGLSQSTMENLEKNIKDFLDQHPDVAKSLNMEAAEIKIFLQDLARVPPHKMEKFLNSVESEASKQTSPRTH